MPQTSIHISPAFADAFRRVLSLPRNEQPAATSDLWATAKLSVPEEEWNSQFGHNSLFGAWTSCTLVRNLYAANALVLKSWLCNRPGWRVVEIGGGDGRLWSYILGSEDEGELVVVDPVPEVHERVRQQLPAKVRLVSVQAPVEDAELGEADAVVCSLTLHHIAGADASERAQHGLKGPGKFEVLREMAKALKPRQGLGILNEADMYSDIGLPPADPVLVDHLLEAYVRRVGFSLLLDAEALVEDPEGLAPRWHAIINRWCLGQLVKAYVPVAERYDYMLDIPRWLELLERAGLTVVDRKCTDNFDVFYRYLLQPA